MATALLWHLHQPEYRDPETGVPCMPWTRLHGLRGYRDLIVESIEEAIPWTLNIVPGLWEQILHYAEGGSDPHLDLTRAAADGLDEAAYHALVGTFVCGNPTMRRPYRRLEDAIASGRRLTVDEIRDLQVHSTLAWFGATALRDYPVLAELRAKGTFDEADKQALLDVQDAILASFPDLLRQLDATEGPSVSTSPLHHPILPLLVDVRHAARSVGHPPDVDFAFPDDALEQLVEGKRFLERFVRVQGCWPSEGAVSPEVVELVGRAGFRWLATDEEVLARSVRTGSGEGGWDLGHGVHGFFRDRELSDRIGFVYAGWSTADAVADFCSRAVSSGVKLVALDGENPWEAFPDAGKGFRAGILPFLREHGITLDQARDREPVGTVQQLHTGSWIGANLEIWSGSPADHRAWALLAETRRACTSEAARPHLLAAEGSDWFWWYGPEFDTPFAPTFDAAFRSHLRAAWRAEGKQPPASLEHPVETAPTRVHPPTAPIVGGPTEAGWLGAGSWVVPQGAMAHGAGLSVQFGWDARGRLHVRSPVEVRIDEGPDGVQLSVGEATVWVRSMPWVV